MLKLFIELAPFFTDNYRELGVREYAKTQDISPPTAAKRLKHYEQEGLLLFREDRRHHLYRAHRTNPLFTDLQRAYYRQQLTPLATHLEEQTSADTIILFGSATNAQLSKESDIDIYIHSEPQETTFENPAEHPVQLHFLPELANKALRKAVAQGVVLRGNGLADMHDKRVREKHRAE